MFAKVGAQRVAQETPGEGTVLPSAHFCCPVPTSAALCSWCPPPAGPPPGPGRRTLRTPGPGGEEQPQQPRYPPAVSCARSGALTPQPLAVVGVEDALVGADPHGPVRVQQQPGETGGEVLHEALGDGAQGQPDISWQLVVVREGSQGKGIPSFVPRDNCSWTAVPAAQGLRPGRGTGC